MQNSCLSTAHLFSAVYVFSASKHFHKYIFQAQETIIALASRDLMLDSIDPNNNIYFISWSISDIVSICSTNILHGTA